MKRLQTVMIIVGIVLASSWALLHPGFFRVHDYIHAARIVEMTTALNEGHLPVRWTKNFGYGYGMPLFEFYAPLPYFVGSLLYRLGMPIIPVIKLLFFLSSLLTAWGSYVLGKKLFGRLGGLVTAAAITLAPYRAVNLFVRGALSEAWGIMAMPWVLYGVLKVVKREQKGWVVLLVSLIALMLSHNIMTMVFVPFSLVFALICVVLYRDTQWKKTVLSLIGSYILAIGASAFYLVPAIAEKGYTQVEAIFSGYFHYSHHFLYIRQFFTDNWGYTGSVWGPDDGISFFLGWGQLLGLGIVLLFLAKRLWLHAHHKHPFKDVLQDKTMIMIGVLGILSGVSLFMSLLKSKFLWDMLPLINFTQFPWRFMGPGIIFIGLLLGGAGALIHSSHLRKIWFVGVTLILLANARYFYPEKFLDNPDDFYYTDADRIQREMSGILPDYIPITLKLPQPQPTARATGEKVEVLTDRGHKVLVKSAASVPQFVEFAIADFPGWQTELDGQPVSKVVTPKGTIAVEVPEGEHLVGAYFGNTPVRLWSDIVSVISIVVVGGLLLPLTKATKYLNERV